MRRAKDLISRGGKGAHVPANRRDTVVFENMGAKSAEICASSARARRDRDSVGRRTERPRQRLGSGDDVGGRERVEQVRVQLDSVQEIVTPVNICHSHLAFSRDPDHSVEKWVWSRVARWTTV